MKEMQDLLNALNGMTPLGVISLLGIVIWMLVKGQKIADSQYNTIANNHLHELPDLVENSRRTVDILQRIEVKLGENFAVIRDRLEGQ